MTDNKNAIWEDNYEAYKDARPLAADCDINEKQNWLGVNQCTESWECKGERKCNSVIKQCEGESACKEKMPDDQMMDFMTDLK